MLNIERFDFNFCGTRKSRHNEPCYLRLQRKKGADGAYEPLGVAMVMEYGIASKVVNRLGEEVSVGIDGDSLGIALMSSANGGDIRVVSMKKDKTGTISIGGMRMCERFASLFGDATAVGLIGPSWITTADGRQIAVFETKEAQA